MVCADRRGYYPRLCTTSPLFEGKALLYTDKSAAVATDTIIDFSPSPDTAWLFLVPPPLHVVSLVPLKRATILLNSFCRSNELTKGHCPTLSYLQRVG